MKEGRLVVNGKTGLIPAAAVCLMAAATLTGCAGSNSSGILTAGAGKPELPTGVPAVVTVAPLEGDYRITGQAAELLEQELAAMGFEVVPWVEAFPHQVEGAPGKAVDGVFSGRAQYTSGESRVETRLVLKLTTLPGGELVWSCDVNDPRRISRDMDPNSSIVYTVGAAVKLLADDLKDARKRASSQ